jgi:hypothetical protein
MGLFDSLRGMVGNLEAQAKEGDEGAKTALGLGAALKGALGAAGDAVQHSAVDRVAAQQHAVVDSTRAAAVSGVCATLGLSTDRAGDLTDASKRKVFKTLVDAIEFYQEHDFRFLNPIHIRRLGSQDGRTTFTMGSSGLGSGGRGVGAQNAALFRDFLDSVHIRYRERTARNLFELGKSTPGSTYVFEIRPDHDVPGRWHELCQIDLKEAVHKLLTMLAELR